MQIPDNCMPFVQKYKPKSLNEYVDQSEAVEVFLKWISKWKSGSKALLFHGPPGIGKTALIEAWSVEKGFECIEMNASDFRSREQIEEVLGKSMMQASLFKKGKIFFLDEIDGVAGRGDLGGIGAIIDIIKRSRYPVILTANKPYEPRLKSLRQYCQLVEFRKIHVYGIAKRLKEICRNEKMEFTDEVLKEIARRSEGDLRSAIEDLEIASQGKKKISIEDLEAIGRREREQTIFEVLRNIFKARSGLAAKLAINNSDKDPEEIFWWIENNILNEYEDEEEIAEAFDKLSRADLFRRRITSRQNWRFRAYMIDLMTAGVSSSKKETYRKFTSYKYPENIMILGRTKLIRNQKNEILKRIAAHVNCSTRKVRQEFLPYMRIFLKNSENRKMLMKDFQIEKEELKFLW